MKTLSAILNIFFPRRCTFCNAVIGFLPACTNCENEKYRRENLLVIKNAEDSAYLDDIFSVYMYDDCIKSAVLRIKFADDIICAKRTAEIFAENFIRADFTLTPELIIFVPNYEKSKDKKRFSYPQILAQTLSSVTNIPISAPITKTRDTKKQHHLSLAERRKNLKGAFVCDGVVRDKTVLIVDDIVTTGNTLNEIAKTLKKSGAKAVYAYTFAEAEHVFNQASTG